MMRESFERRAHYSEAEDWPEGASKERPKGKANGSGSSNSRPGRRYTLRSAEDFASTPPAQYRVKGVFLCESIAAIFGASGSGKSFIGLDLAFAIDDGREWFGKKTKPCPVLYIALEGVSGQAQRVKAYLERHGAGARLRFITVPFSLLEPGDVDALVSTIQEAGMSGGVVIIDTFNAATPGMSENESDGMSLAISAANLIRAEFGGLVILIHHSGKDPARGMRGHSSLPAALDTIIEVSREQSSERRTWKITKSRDGLDGEEHGFRLERLEVGTDADGDSVSSCVVVSEGGPSDVPKRKPAPAGGNQRVIWDGLGALFRESQRCGEGGAPPGRPCVELEAAVEALQGRLTCEARRRGQRTREAITGLLNRDLLKSGEGWIWCA